MRTTTLRLGTAVIVLPWHNPVLLAEQAATLDLVSGGRLDFGIGKGYRHSEFKGFRIPPEEAERASRRRSRSSPGRACRASASRIAAASGNSRTSWSSRRRRRSRIRRSGLPPASEASIRNAAARGFNLILDQYASPEPIGERIALYRAEREANGHGFDPMQIAVARQLYVSKDEADAEAALARQAQYTQRIVDVSRGPDRERGSHVLAYADSAGGTEANALYGTPDEICRSSKRSSAPGPTIS